MNKELFNDWSSTYNDSIKKSEQNKTYPFYGYVDIQKYIFETVNQKNQSNILEMGIGTGMMTKSVYDNNHIITGVDFSHKMIEEAKKIMPNSKYIESDFINSLPKLKDSLYDTIIFSYSIHHLTPLNQRYVLDKLSRNLKQDGVIIIGDVITRTNDQMKLLASKYKKIWDDEEFYPTYEVYNNQVINNKYHHKFIEVTECSGIIELRKK